jgi:peptidoglycan-N-acetylglucosamine deacetylase
MRKNRAPLRVAHVVVLLFLLGLTRAVFPALRAAEKVARPWHDRKCAVVLTYDDALNVHLTNAVPLLDSLGFKATFYLSGFFPSFRQHVDDWIKVARSGHELGNHTLFHPCDGRAPDRNWVKPEYDLSRYTVRRMVDEILMANVLLQTMDGKSERTFAYPCGDILAGDSSYIGEIQKIFPGARGVESRTESLDRIDLYTIGSYMINGESASDLKHLVDEAMAKNGLVVFLFHGVGGEHNLNVTLADHRQLLYYLNEHERDIWVAPMIDVVRYVRKTRKLH